MRILIGIILIAIGIIAFLFGDKKLNVSEGLITKIVFPPLSKTRGKVLKYLFGCVLVYIGLRVIFDPWF
jgi:uncharacterized membrane protein